MGGGVNGNHQKHLCAILDLVKPEKRRAKSQGPSRRHRRTPQAGAALPQARAPAAEEAGGLRPQGRERRVLADLGTLSGESGCVCVQLRVPCRVVIQEVGVACVPVGVEVEFHAARFCVSRHLVVIPLEADWRECFWKVPVLSAALHPTLEGAVEC